MADRSTDGFSGAKAAEIVGITYRQLDYWARTDLVRPSLGRRQGQRQPPAVLLPRPARAAGDQVAARRRHQARVGARGVQLPAREPRRGRHHRQPGHPGQPGRAGPRRGRAHRPRQAGPGRAQRAGPGPRGRRRRRPHRRAPPDAGDASRDPPGQQAPDRPTPSTAAARLDHVAGRGGGRSSRPLVRAERAIRAPESEHGSYFEHGSTFGGLRRPPGAGPGRSGASATWTRPAGSSTATGSAASPCRPWPTSSTAPSARSTRTSRRRRRCWPRCSQQAVETLRASYPTARHQLGRLPRDRGGRRRTWCTWCSC